MNKINLVLDTYVLGQEIKTGVYRVCDELFRRLAKQSEFKINYLIRENTKKGSIDYLGKNNLNQEIVSENEIHPSKAYDILLSPFGVAPPNWSNDPHVLHAHIIYDLIAIYKPNFFTNEASNEVKKIIDGLTKNTLIFAISEYTRQDLLKYRPDLSCDQIIVIPLAAGKQFVPCHSNEFIQLAKKRYSIPVNAPYILSLATLEIRKNLDSVVNAFILYMNNNPLSELFLVLAGMSGWKLESLNESLIKAGNWRNRIVLTGFIEDQDLSAIYSGAKCFIYLSQYEGFGLPPLEAMACGTPVICANNSSLPEVVGNAGLLIDANDISAAANSIALICESESLHTELSLKGLERAKQFSWEECTSTVTQSLQYFFTLQCAKILTKIDNSEIQHRVRYATYLGYRNGDYGVKFRKIPCENNILKFKWIDFLPKLNELPRKEGGLRLSGYLKSGNVDQPLITYVTVVRNGENTLERTICSVQAQTYQNVEHIILDGASNDGTLNIIDRYINKIDYFVSESDLGLYDALNKAIPLARGQLICVLNADDWLEPNAAQIVVKYIQTHAQNYKEESLMLFTAAKVLDGKIVHQWDPAVVHPGSYFMCANDCHNGIYANKKAYELAGLYDTTYKIAADFKWIMKALDEGVHFVYTNEVTVNYSLGGTSSNFLGHSYECMRVIEDKFPFLNKKEVMGLYHCFFIFHDENNKIIDNLPSNHTDFLRKLLANHANDSTLVESIGWASITKMNHPKDLILLPDSFKLNLKYKIIEKLKNYPIVFNTVKYLYKKIKKRV